MENLELFLFLMAASVTTGILMVGARHAGKLRLCFMIVPLFCIAMAIVWLPPDSQLQQLKQEVPQVGRREFAGSDSCRSCHISHYESWHRSYHRTMTQLASEQSVLAPFDGQVLQSSDSRCSVERQGDWFIVEMVDPDWEADQYRDGVDRGHDPEAPRVRLPVVLTTGSHHLQTYWVPSQHGNKVRLFPWVYHVDTQRWIPNRDSFILPPDSKRHSQVWNNSCIACHSVAGDAGYEPGNWQSRVAEFGISCEACHGPGAAHVEHHRNPMTRYEQRLSDRPDPTIVNPARLASAQASEVCGQCHAAFNEEVSPPYNTYRAGEDFHSVFTLADPKNPEDVRFWSDGTMRVGGREYNGMVQSACYLQGELSCLSCHSMHGGEPDKQMQPAMRGDQACIQCHEKFAGDISAHTHHAPESAGSRCYNCHMPYTSYALFAAVRSHRIDSPSLNMSVENGRPNACNQCHVDQTLAWTGKHLENWYDIAPVELNDDERAISAAVLWMLRGDAVQRALAAWSLAWEPARQASGAGWQAPFLAQLLDDPYSMVRYMGHQSLRRLGTDVPGYDSLVAPTERPPVAPTIQAQKPARSSKPLADGLQPFFDGQQPLNMELLKRLLQQRDDRPITLNE